MARRAVILGSLALVLLAAPAAHGQIGRKKKELARIQSELRRTLAELDSLRVSQGALGQDVSRLEGLDGESRRRLERLRTDVARAETRRAELQARLAAAAQVGDFWRSALESEAAHLAAARADRSDFHGARELWSEEFRRAAVLEKARHLRGLQGFRRRTEQDESQARRRAAELAGSRRRAQEERERRRREYEAKKAELAATQARVAEAARKARELEESAKAMSALIERLARRAGAAQRPGRLDLPPRSLPWPARGAVLNGFGRERDARLGTWVVREGILLGTAPGAAVAAVAAGKLIFAGLFRSYGRVAIVDHGGGFFSVYGFLGAVLKEKGAVVAAGERIADAGPAQDGGRVYFEIRRGAQALDPLAWLQPLNR
ncbi:MAG: peptidoglycan DD-metalloendopeptidase family protein [Elusimicrobia bacterium]|nr:peptidoglycan DD-metalloendopeptidase family protein [Elusimicrobiota bacterium]